ncbi:hypothetical protein J8J40_27235, partial [Mycobacterium tuberculosis]|nr:hypothetical protein [Mycobacterium tuberculosis]
MSVTKREFLLGAAAAATMLGGTRGARAATAINYWHHFASQSEMAGLLQIINLFAASQGNVSVSQEGIPQTEY